MFKRENLNDTDLTLAFDCNFTGETNIHNYNLLLVALPFQFLLVALPLANIGSCFTQSIATR